MDNYELDAFLRQIRLEERVVDPEVLQRMRGVEIRFSDQLRLQGQPSSRIRFTFHGRFQPTPPHRHDYVEVMYLYDGNVTQRWANESARLKRGDFFFIPPGVFHWTDICGAGDIAVNLMLSAADFSETLNIGADCPALRRWLETDAGDGRPLWLQAGDGRTRETVLRLLAEAFDPDKWSGEAIERGFSLLLLDLERAASPAAEKEKGRLDRIIRYIEREYRTVTLAQCAAEFGYTPNYLSALLKKELGQSFSDFRRSFSMAQASVLLRESSLPVTEVASQSGFSNMTHFYRIFERTFHMTPAAYRAHGQPPDGSGTDTGENLNAAGQKG